MPERNIIQENLLRLPVISVLKVPDDHEVWESSELGAHFKVTKNVFGNPRRGFTLYTLSVSGTIIGREKVIADFIDYLGRPVERIGDIFTPKPQFLAWEANGVDRVLNTST